MAKTRYSKETGTKIMIASVFAYLIAGIGFIVFSFARSGRFNEFKKELTEISGAPKSRVSIEYYGKANEIAKQDFGRIDAILASARRRDYFNESKVLDTLNIHLTSIGGEYYDHLQNRYGYVQVTYESDESVYLLVPVFLFEHTPSNRTDAKIRQANNATFQRPGDYEPRVSLYNNNARNIASFRNFAQTAALRRRDFNQTAV
ncbi:MAG: hypothetical protein ACOYI3_07160 [Christensenellales bacterium]